MRTTIRIDDDLYRTLKERAARSGRPVSAVIEDVIRLGLRPDTRTKHRRFTVEASGSGGLVPGVDLSSNSAVQEAIDDSVPLDALR
ncbi:MAG: ribbon-helix-helix protein, CopG family [Acidimicrobiia bacterium]|nr:ribbon-helix-helix protein, CopG family [Acidimicrobiia bacterium]